MSATQTARIRRWLEAHGELRGHEWASSPAPDGGAPILRYGARVKELRSQGMRIVTVEQRPSALYRLEVSSGSPTTGCDGPVVPAAGAAGAGFGEPAAPENLGVCDAIHVGAAPERGRETAASVTNVGAVASRVAVSPSPDVAELVEFRGPDAMLAAFIDPDGQEWWAA